MREGRALSVIITINSRSCGSFFLRFTLWIAPLLPTEGIHLANYLEPHVKPRTKESLYPSCYNG